MRELPVVAKGKQYVIARTLDIVAKFVGIEGAAPVPLPPPELCSKWINVLRAAQRYIRQVPRGQLYAQAAPGNSRSIRLLGLHIFRIGKAYLECVQQGAQNLELLIVQPFPEGTLVDGEEIASYGADVIRDIGIWWDGLADKSCRQRVDIKDYGDITLHQLLERCAWHSAHHTRQLADVLQQSGIQPEGMLTADDLAGLPLPERVWD